MGYPNGEIGLGPVPEGGGGNGTGCKPNCDDTAPPTIQPVANPFGNQLFAPQPGKLHDIKDWNHNQDYNDNNRRGEENGQNDVNFDEVVDNIMRAENIKIEFGESLYISIWLICGLLLLCALTISWMYFAGYSGPIHSESCIESA